MILLPWVVTTFLSSWNDNCGTVVRIFERCKYYSDSVQRAVIGSKPDAALTHVQSLWYVLQARRTLRSRRGLAQFDQPHVAHLVDSATWFSWYLSTNRYEWILCLIQFFNFSNFLLISFIFSSPCKVAFWDTPSTRRSISNCGVFSTAGSKPRSSLLIQVWSSVGEHLTSVVRLAPLATTFLELVTSSQIDCCCCCDCQLLFGVTFWRWSWGWVSFEQCSISVLRINSVNATCWHRTVYNDCVGLRLPELQSLIWCSG